MPKAQIVSQSHDDLTDDSSLQHNESVLIFFKLYD